MTGGNVGDPGMPWKHAILELPFQRFAQVASGSALVGAGVGAASAEISTSGQGAFVLDTIADELFAYISRGELQDFDLTRPLRARLSLSCGTAPTVNGSIRCDLKGLANGQTISLANATPDATGTFVLNGTNLTQFESDGGNPIGLNGSGNAFVNDIGVMVGLTVLGLGGATGGFFIQGLTLFGTRKTCSDDGAQRT